MTKTTREIETRKNKNTMWFAVILAVIISFGLMWLVLGVHEAKYHQKLCNVGREEIAGDYKSNSDDFFITKQCAVEDCVAFNKIHESIDGYDGMRCVV